MAAHVCGIDIGKTVFHLIGLSKDGHIVAKKRFSRKQLTPYTANIPACLVGIEACPGAHFLARALVAQGHAVKLMPAEYVRPFVKSNKNDYVDAEAIAEAVQRPTMRFVPIKTESQLDLQALHRVRDRRIGRQRAVINQIRGFLLEHGIVVAVGRAHLKRAIPSIFEDADNFLSPRMRSLLVELRDEWEKLEEQIDATNRQLAESAKKEDGCRRLLTIAGIGPLTATALTAAIGNGAAFRKSKYILDESLEMADDCRVRSGVVTLFELLRFNATMFIAVGLLLREMETLAKLTGDFGPGHKFSEVDLQRIVACCNGMGEMCQRHKLTMSSRKCRRILDCIERDVSPDTSTMNAHLKELRERIEDELQDEQFLHLTSSEAETYRNPLVGWETICTRFAEVQYNVEESSKCFALERYGASVFHVLQVAEYGVIKVSELLNVQGDKPGWSSVKRLADLLKPVYADRQTEVQKHTKLLENVVPLAIVIKDSWRHKLDHVDNQLKWIDTDFSPAVADEIIFATRAFMRKLALELPEKL